jgi:hypothetical protein
LRVACEATERGTRPGLVDLLTDVIDKIQQVAEFLSQIYFSHAAIARRLSGPGEEELT